MQTLTKFIIEYFWAISTTVIGAAFVGYIVYRNNNINRFNNACDPLITAFSSELAALKNPAMIDSPDPYDILLCAVDRHRTAINIFRRNLPFWQRRNYDKAWRNYYGYAEDEINNSDYLLKYSPSWTQDTVQENRNKAIKNIERVLRFAKHK